jgi:hypothetical protein
MTTPGSEIPHLWIPIVSSGLMSPHIITTTDFCTILSIPNLDHIMCCWAAYIYSVTRSFNPFAVNFSGQGRMAFLNALQGYLKTGLKMMIGSWRDSTWNGAAFLFWRAEMGRLR